jgi:hypothetical protein
MIDRKKQTVAGDPRFFLAERDVNKHYIEVDN